jgi:hypothetical protein
MTERDDPLRDPSADESSERRDWDLPPDVAPDPDDAAAGEGRGLPPRPQPPAEPDEPGRAG